MAKRKKSKKKKFNTNFKKAVRRDSERQQQSQSSYGFLKLPNGIPIFNPKPSGRVKLDIMPYEVTLEKHPDRYDDEGIAIPGELWYKLPFNIHRDIGVENDAVVCPRTFGKPCPICEYKEKRLKEGAEWEEVKELKISQRNLYVVIPKKSKDHDEKPHIWEMSQFLFQNLLNQELEEDEDNAIFPDLEEGLTLKIRFDSSRIGDSKPFPEASRIDFYERDHAYDMDILDDIPNLDECLEILSYKALEAKFMELDPEDIVHEDEEDLTVDEEEEDDWDEEEEDDWDDEEEEEDEPKRRKKSVKPEKKVKPKKKAKKKSKPKPEPEEEDEVLEQEFEFEEDWDFDEDGFVDDFE